MSNTPLEFFKENVAPTLEALETVLSSVLKFTIEEDEELTEAQREMLHQVGGISLLLSYINGEYDEKAEKYYDENMGYNPAEALVVNASITTFAKSIEALEENAMKRFVNSEGMELYNSLLGSTTASLLMIKELASKFGYPEKYEELRNYLRNDSPDLFIKIENYKEKMQW